ncbi:MAG: chromosome partitioning protein ParA, partial [Rhodothermia bacterium]|nr:chromosome partitioning protein ParA [Rhodothermia bacterium]
SKDTTGEESGENEKQSDGQDGERNDDTSSKSSDESPDSEQNQDDPSKERLAAEQERSEEEMRDLEKRLQEIQEMMDEMPQNAGQRLQQLRDELRQQGLPEEMQKNAEQLRNQELQPAMEGQQQMQQQLSRLQEQLSQMQQNMQGNQLQLNIAGLRQVLNDILVLSQQQEETRNDVSETEADSPALRNYARLQVELGEGLRVVSDTLQKLSREIPEMSRQVQAETGKALREIQMATESLADRSARRASGHQKASMMHLNELALLLSDLLNMLMNQQMGMGMPSMEQMLQQMQQMAGQQQQLNDQIQQMLNDMHGQRLTKDMQARMRQLAEQQARIREQLKEMSRNPELRGKALGDLDKIAEQMEETIRQLEHSRVNRELIERQQQILTRLLDASRSINQRGKEERREGRTGEDLNRESPAELTPDEQVNQLRRDLIRALESGYAQDYEELIRRYFNLLQQDLEPVPAE